MASTFPLPQQTYDPAHGPYLFGPQSVAPTDTLIRLTIDRTIAGGLNSLDANTSVEIKAEQSNDGGVSWFLAVAADCPGGLYAASPPPKGPGGNILASVVGVNVYGSGSGRQLRATITVTGSPVVLAGTLTVS